MATKIVKYTGLVKWAKLFPTNVNKGWDDDDKGPFASIDFSFDDPDEAKAFKAEKTKKEFKEDEENGRSYVQFRRYTENLKYPKFGGCPRVADKDNNPWPEKVLIGNGSKATIWVQVYETKNGRKGTRLEAVRIDDLVPYESGNKDDMNPNDEIPF
jgi:hypothetical protein